jgi:hypothetical protein
MPHGDSDIQWTDQSLSEAMQNRGKRPRQIAGAQQNDPLFCLTIKVEWIWRDFGWIHGKPSFQ